jgi:hypothetical protein
MPLNDIITYGESVKAFVAMLCSEGLVSINRIKTIVFEITNGVINLSMRLFMIILVIQYFNLNHYKL